MIVIAETVNRGFDNKIQFKEVTCVCGVLNFLWQVLFTHPSFLELNSSIVGFTNPAAIASNYKSILDTHNHNVKVQLMLTLIAILRQICGVN